MGADEVINIHTCRKRLSISGGNQHNWCRGTDPVNRFDYDCSRRDRISTAAPSGKKIQHLDWSDIEFQYLCTEISLWVCQTYLYWIVWNGTVNFAVTYCIMNSLTRDQVSGSAVCDEHPDKLWHFRYAICTVHPFLNSSTWLGYSYPWSSILSCECMFHTARCICFCIYSNIKYPELLLWSKVAFK